jgi:S-adenosylmethionine synthetase
MKKSFVFSSDSVTAGHPDKLCDQISDAIVDRFLRLDPFARVIAECAVSDGILFIASRFAARATVDIPEIARAVIDQVGYQRDDFNARTCTVMTSLAELPALANGEIDEAELTDAQIERIPARNIANAFGFACNHNEAMLPMPLWLAHKLARRLASMREQKRLAYLGPDGKTQVSVEFRDGKPLRVQSITLVASQIEPEIVDPKRMRDDLLAHVVTAAFEDESVRPDADTTVHINPDGPFLVGGPTVHSGLTGRKNAIDTYGEYSRHSESALSGKDPSRIDRIGAYAARHAAKNIVAAGLAAECEVQLTYSIGRARPISIQADSRGTGTVSDETLAELVREHFELRPAGIVRDFALRRQSGEHKGGFYRRLAAYGHVGRLDLEVPWERTEKLAILRRAAKRANQ